MPSIVAQIKAMPERERLPFALDALKRLTCDDEFTLGALQRAFGVSRQEAKFLWALSTAPKLGASHEYILDAVTGRNEDISPKLTAVLACKIRKKTDLEIRTIWGTGFEISEESAAKVLRAAGAPYREIPDMPLSPETRVSKRGHSWTAQDDEDLLLMIESGSDTWVIADELERTERAITERFFTLKRAGRA